MEAVTGVAEVPEASTTRSSCNRIKPIAGGKNFVVENANVAKHFFGDRMKNDVKTLDEVPNGEGRILSIGGKKVAAYRDPSGKLSTRSAVCTHMKGIVQWNTVEKTFDCPLHGARYSACGTCIEGPALHDLVCYKLTLFNG